MARAPVSKTGGWGFEPLHSCQPRQGFCQACQGFPSEMVGFSLTAIFRS
jgi:hypothetical protein